MIEIKIRIPPQRRPRLFGFGKFAFSWTKTITRQFAEEASELDTRQLLTFCRTMAEKFSSEGAMKIVLLSRLYEIPLRLLYLLTNVQLAQLTLYLNPLLENRAGRFRITENHLSRLKIKTFWKAKLLMGPGDNFSHVRLGEFIVADQYFEAYQRSVARQTAAAAAQEDQYLDLLIATLWRERAKKSTNSDWRVPFQSGELQERAKWTKKLPAEEKMLIYFYFAGCKADLAEHYDTLFSGSSEDEGGRHSGGDWLDLVRTLPNEKFGTIEECEQLFIHVVFDLVNRMMADQKKAKTLNG